MERSSLLAEAERLASATEAGPSVAASDTAAADAAAARLAAVYTRLADIDADGAPARAASILAGLSFDEAMQGRATKTFSGGQSPLTAACIEARISTMQPSCLPSGAHRRARSWNAARDAPRRLAHARCARACALCRA